MSVLKNLKEQGFSLFAAVPREGQSAEHVNWTRRDAIVIGNESHGLPSQVLQMAQPVSLVMTSETESLNAGVAGSILIYERARRKT